MRRAELPALSTGAVYEPSSCPRSSSRQPEIPLPPDSIPDVPEAKPIVVVAGMHRSGTSLLAGMLASRGLKVGRGEQLLPAARRSNVLGHWELAEVVRLNDKILRECGAHWAGPVAVSTQRLEEVAAGPLGDLGRNIVAGPLARVDLVKDPRFCLTLPFWRALLDDQVVVVVPWRSPREVALSLTARNDFPEKFGLTLWDEYHRRLVDACRGLPRLVVSHRELIDNSTEVMSVVEAFLSEHAVRPSVVTSSSGMAVNKSLVHHRDEGALSDGEQMLIDAIGVGGPDPPVLTDSEVDRRQLLFGVVAALANELDGLRSQLQRARYSRPRAVEQAKPAS